MKTKHDKIKKLIPDHKAISFNLPTQHLLLPYMTTTCITHRFLPELFF